MNNKNEANIITVLIMLIVGLLVGSILLIYGFIKSIYLGIVERKQAAAIERQLIKDELQELRANWRKGKVINITKFQELLSKL